MKPYIGISRGKKAAVKYPSRVAKKQYVSSALWGSSFEFGKNDATMSPTYSLMLSCWGTHSERGLSIVAALTDGQEIMTTESRVFHEE